MEGALVVLSVCLGFFLAGRFMKPIRALAAATDAVTQRRDYSIRVEKTSQDELGVLCDGFNSMLDQIQQQESELGRSNSELEKTVGNQRTMLAQLQERETELKSANTELDRTIQGVRDAVVQLSSMSEELTATVSQQSTGARQQAHAISETVATVSQITQTSSHASERANSAREAAKRALEVGKDGRQAVLDSIEAMEEVNKQVGATAVNTVSLAERVLAISRILRTISDIAEQTNVLALNAAIEASRAGEQGKGFAVVAKEVKHLAASSKDATDQIRQIIREIHEATNTTVRSTEEGTQSAQRARSIVSKAGKTIDALADALVETSQAATQIVASSNQQARGIADVNDAMKQINATTQQQIAVAHQIEQTAQFLTQLSDGLSRLIKADDSTAE
jgi:methyl-accepting chemotaxis protein